MAPKVRKLLIILCALIILACAAWKIILVIQENSQYQKEEEIRTLKPGASLIDWFFPSAYAEEEEEPVELPPVS